MPVMTKAMRRELGVAAPPSGFYAPKLDEDKVRLIRQLSTDGVGYKVIAHNFGISLGMVHRIVRYKSWKHVD